MWATVGAALKKIAVALLGNPKVLKTIGGIVLGLIIIIVMPVVAIVSIFNGDIEIDTNELQRMVVENLSAEEQAKLQFVEDTMYAIEREMKASGFSDPRVTEAQVLFTLSLYDYAQEADFVSKLVGCFASEQTDEQLIAAVNAAFGTAISAEEFSQVMGAIRSVYIDTSGYIDPCTKNNLDLVEWAKQAKLRGWGYVWVTYGEVLTRSYYRRNSTRTRWAVMRILSRATGSVAAPPTATGSLRDMAGLTRIPMRSSMEPMGCRTSAPIPCTPMLQRRAR